MTTQAEKIRAWMKEHRAPYMSEAGRKSRFFYFDFDESGNVMIPGTIKHLIEFFKILTEKDKVTFFKLVTFRRDVSFDEDCNASWDLIPASSITDRYISMEDYISECGIDVDKLKTDEDYQLKV